MPEEHLEAKYRCREAGNLFNNLEDHDVHYRRSHLQMEAGSLAEIYM